MLKICTFSSIDLSLLHKSTVGPANSKFRASQVFPHQRSPPSPCSSVGDVWQGTPKAVLDRPPYNLRLHLDPRIRHTPLFRLWPEGPPPHTFSWCKTVVEPTFLSARGTTSTERLAARSFVSAGAGALAASPSKMYAICSRLWPRVSG